MGMGAQSEERPQQVVLYRTWDKTGGLYKRRKREDYSQGRPARVGFWKKRMTGGKVIQTRRFMGFIAEWSRGRGKTATCDLL